MIYLFNQVLRFSYILKMGIYSGHTSIVSLRIQNYLMIYLLIYKSFKFSILAIINFSLFIINSLCLPPSFSFFKFYTFLLCIIWSREVEEFLNEIFDVEFCYSFLQIHSKFPPRPPPKIARFFSGVPL